MGRGAAASRILQALLDVGLTENGEGRAAARALPARVLSGGPAPQRIAIARRALIVNSEGWVVLDEPTSALDVTIQKQVAGVARRPAAQVRPELHPGDARHRGGARPWRTASWLMKDSRIVESGPLEEVLGSPKIRLHAHAGAGGNRLAIRFFL